MTYIPRNIAEYASARETSGEIALAIFEIADEGDEERMWAEPTKAESDTVIALAWTYADADESTLFWGVETFRR